MRSVSAQVADLRLRASDGHYRELLVLILCTKPRFCLRRFPCNFPIWSHCKWQKNYWFLDHVPGFGIPLLSPLQMTMAHKQFQYTNLSIYFFLSPFYSRQTWRLSSPPLNKEQRPPPTPWDQNVFMCQISPSVSGRPILKAC